MLRTYAMVNATNIPIDICDQCMSLRENLIFEYLAYRLSTGVFDLLHIGKTRHMSMRFHSYDNLRFTRGPPNFAFQDLANQ